MNYDATLFRESDAKSAAISFRLTPRQKDIIIFLSAQRGTSPGRYLLGLVARAYEDMVNPAVINGNGSIISTETNSSTCDTAAGYGSAEAALHTRTETDEQRSARIARELNRRNNPTTYR
jgi:hypothetical protein